MSPSEFQGETRWRVPGYRTGPTFSRRLVREAGLTAAEVIRLRRDLQSQDIGFPDLLLAETDLPEARLLALLADHHGVSLWQPDAGRLIPVPGLPVEMCLRHRLLVWEDATGRRQLVAADPEEASRLRQQLPAPLRGLPLQLGRGADIHAALAQGHRALLSERMSARPPAALSCRSWQPSRARQVALAVLLGIGLLLGLVTAAGREALALWAVATLLIAVALKGSALIALLMPRRPPPPIAPLPAVPGIIPLYPTPDRTRLPRISILVPLFRERSIAQSLLRRLALLDYPRALLEIVLVLEEDDQQTRDVVAATPLPRWFKVVVVPRGLPQTKPRAMNYALDFCAGSVIGIYDAEDAPDPDQLRKVAAHFARAPAQVACLQGALDYYNPRQNWIARCFTIEYASWFRVVLPGFARLGFGLPLGGTTLFIRRAVLEEVGRWDAHNVTEDADLGYRLYRYGYRTEILDSTTREEANCFALRWVKQRSRWLKGYMVTYLVHMRRPLRLLQELGAWRFLGFQAHFVSALSQFLLAPVFWGMWLIALGLNHPLQGAVSDAVFATLVVSFFLFEGFSILLGLMATRGPDHRHLMPWVPTLILYFPLGCLAAYKALYELALCPFYWDKTDHGHSDETQATDAAAPPAAALAAGGDD